MRREISPARRRFLHVTTVALAIVIFGLWFTLFRSNEKNPATTATKRANATEGQPPGTATDVSLAIREAERSLRRMSDQSAIQQQLDNLRLQLQSMPKDYASAGIQDFLNSKADATTYLGFKVGQNGFLTASPSLRVFLLDYLAQVDPAAAASYATGILTTMDSPDEWAVALRDYARGNSGVEGRAFLEQKLEAMLTHDAWLREPSVGFLEAFDLAAFVGGRKLVAPLTDLVRRKDNQAVARAAFLALDRMVIREPLEMLTVLEQRPDMMSGREQTRANYFARGDVRDPTQRRIVESYLLDPKRDPSEVQAFAAAFPNANYMISRNLLTVVETPDGNTLLQRDRETLPVIGEWMTDPRFEQLRPHLARTQQRLSNFVRQAETSRGP